jgi:hypothetical protein
MSCRRYCSVALRNAAELGPQKALGIEAPIENCALSYPQLAYVTMPAIMSKPRRQMQEPVPLAVFIANTDVHATTN